MPDPLRLTSALPDDLKVSELTVGELKMLIWELLQLALANQPTSSPSPSTPATDEITEDSSAGNYDAW